MNKKNLLSTLSGWIFISASLSHADDRIVVAETERYRYFSNHDIESTADWRIETGSDPEFEWRDRMPGVEAVSAERGALSENAVPGLWKGFGGVPYGCNGDIVDIEKGPDGRIYLGGSFSACNDVIVNNVAAWDPDTNTFHALGSPGGVNDRVRDLEFDADGDLLVAGDSFNRAGGQSLFDYIVRWDGSQWSTLSADRVDGSVHDIAIDPATGDLYAVGTFDSVELAGGGQLSVNRVAKWDGTQWSALGLGVNSFAGAVTVLDGVVYVGGRFSQAGATAANRIAAWDGTQWQALSSGVDSTVSDLDTDGTRVFVAGSFDTAGGVNTGPVAVWNPAAATWTSINGPACCVGAIDYDAGRLLVVGGFSSVPGVNDADRVAIWNGSAWSATPDSSAHSGFTRGALVDGGDLYIGGDFAVIGTFSPEDFPSVGTFANRIARFDATSASWQALGNGDGNNLNGSVLTASWFNEELWLAGTFQAAGTIPVEGGVVRWDGSEWLSIPSEDLPCSFATIRRLASDGAGRLYAGTSCITSGGVTWGRTAVFDGTNWAPVGNGVDSSVNGIEIDPSSGDAYYFGRFTGTLGDAPIAVNRIARWDGFGWNPVGSGAQNGVSDSGGGFADIDNIALQGGDVMVEGFFDRAGTTALEGLALWDGSSWSQPGDGLQWSTLGTFVDDLETLGSSVFAAGFFDRSGSQPMLGVAEWDGTDWAPLQGAVGEGAFRVTLLHAADPHLYVGGRLTSAGGRPADQLARWDGADWASLGAGAENGLARADAVGTPVTVIQSTPEGVFVGGRFGGTASVTSPDLIRFVPMEDLDLAIDASVLSAAGGEVVYEIVLTNNGDFVLVDSELAANWSPAPSAVSWSCQPVAPAVRGCPQPTGAGGLGEILELPAGASVRFEVTVDANLVASPFLELAAEYRATPVPGATGKTSDSVILQTGASAEAVFRDDFEG